MDLGTWHEALRIRVKSLYTTMRILYGQVAAPGTFLVSATRLGGHHGYDEAGAIAPMGGAVTGFIQAYRRGRTDALVKAVDFESGGAASEIANRVIEETLRDPGAVEIGYQGGLRSTQLAILVELNNWSGQPPTLAELADALVIERSALGHTLRPLEREGWLTLQRGEDRRQDVRGGEHGRCVPRLHLLDS